MLGSAREYITKGLRERAAELVTLDPRTDLEIEKLAETEVEGAADQP